MKKWTNIVLATGLTVVSFGCATGSGPGGDNSTPKGVMTLCVTTEDAEDITLQITSISDEGVAVTDDESSQPYNNYLVVTETAPHDMPNDCGTKKPYKAVNMRADVGTLLHAQVRVSAVRSSARLSCFYRVNGNTILATRGEGRNSLSCLYTGRV
jgi:hypothetical protein